MFIVSVYCVCMCHNISYVWVCRMSLCPVCVSPVCVQHDDVQTQCVRTHEHFTGAFWATNQLHLADTVDGD